MSSVLAKKKKETKIQNNEEFNSDIRFIKCKCRRIYGKSEAGRVGKLTRLSAKLHFQYTDIGRQNVKGRQLCAT